MIFLVVGGAAVLLPYLLLPVIPGTDYANHLARLSVLGAAPASVVRKSFTPHWALMPNLGLDLVYMALKSVASPDLVMRLSLVGALASMLACAAAIQRSLFKTSSMALAFMPLCCAGLPVAMGYLNFVMSSAFVLLGAWLSLAWRAHFTWPRMLSLAAIGAAAWLCHLAGYAMLMLFILCVRLQETVPSGPTFGSALNKATKLASATLQVLAIASPGLAMTAFAERAISSGEIAYGFSKLRCLLAPFVASGTSSDFLLWAGVLTLAFLLCRVGAWRVAAPARLGLIVLLGAIVLLPWQIGPAIDVDSRLAPCLSLIFVASSRIDPLRGLLAGPALMSVLALLIVSRDMALVGSGVEEARSVAIFRAADPALQPGSAMMVANDLRRQPDCSDDGHFSSLNPHIHLAAYAIVDRGVWEPYFFAGLGMQPIRTIRPGFPVSPRPTIPPSLDAVEQSLRGDGRITGAPGTDPELLKMPQGWPDRFSYLLILGHGCNANPVPGLLKPQAKGPGFTLFALATPAKG